MQETKRKTEDAVRINKYLSQAGICSRRQADTYVEEGRVEVDGEVAVSGTKVLPGQSVTFDGKPVKIQEDLIFLAFISQEESYAQQVKKRKIILSTILTIQQGSIL